MTAPATAAARRYSQARIGRLLRGGVGAARAAAAAGAVAGGRHGRAAVPPGSAAEGQARREDREELAPIDEAALVRRPLEPVALLADVGHLGLAVDLGEGHEVDHRVLAAGVGKLELAAVAKGVVGAGVDADAAQDAGALVDLELLEDARLRH